MRLGNVKVKDTGEPSGSLLGPIPTQSLIDELVRRGAVEYRAIDSLYEGDKVLVLEAERTQR
jgi:hypothetical protein